MKRRKLTAISTVLALGMIFFGGVSSVKAQDEYFKSNNEKYYEDNEPIYYKGSVYDKYQWAIKRVTNNGASFYLEPGNHNVVVGIIDSGIDTEHPDLKGNLLGGKNLVPAGFKDDETETGDINDIEDRNGHGTEVAGEIAANGMAKGVAPGIGIRCYRVSGKYGAVDTSILAKAVMSAVDDGVNVINISSGSFVMDGDLYYTDPSTGEIIKDEEYSDYLKDEVNKDRLLKKAIDYANEHNVVVVVSAGNDGTDCSNSEMLIDNYNQSVKQDKVMYKGKIYHAPGGYSNVITVSATKRDDTLASYSNYGQGFITVAAPGGDSDLETGIITLEDGNMVTMMYNHAYKLDCGTSLAAPKVSAEAALILCKYGNLTPEEVKKRICDTADKVGDESKYGAGIINVYNALK